MLILFRVQPEQQAQSAKRDAPAPGPAAVIACHGQRTVVQPRALAMHSRSRHGTISKRRDGNGLP